MKTNELLSMSSIINNRSYLSPFFRKKLGYIGYLGHYNLGDDAIYLAFHKLFPKLKLLPFKCTKKTEIAETILRIKLFHSVFIGGGTLIFSEGETLKLMYKALDKYKKVYVFGAGVKNPYFWEIIGSGSGNYEQWIECLRRCESVSVRGPLSKKILEEKKFSADVIGDPALSLGKNKIIRKSGGKLLGICIGTGYGKLWGNENNISEFIVKFAQIIINRGWQVQFLSVQPDDDKYSQETIRKIGKNVSIIYGYKSIDMTMDFLEKCDVFIGQKLHSVILAMCSYTPSIMLEYRPKCLDFMLSVGLEKFNMRTDSLDLELLLYLLDELRNKNEYYQDYIFKKVAYYKQIQLEKARIITDVIHRD